MALIYANNKSRISVDQRRLALKKLLKVSPEGEGFRPIARTMNFSLPASAIDIGTGESYRQQEFESWGTSLERFGNSLGTWANQQSHDEVMDLLFDRPNNLGLNYARYNIAGGQNRLLLDNFRQGAAIPGWVPTAPSSVTDTSTWEWNWNADPGQRKSLDSAIARGVNRVDAIAYSAPYWMTSSGDAVAFSGQVTVVPLKSTFSGTPSTALPLASRMLVVAKLKR